ncbi:MAG: hypothetical protein HC802_21230 [Caldilineaceae bacterium]|nr:hypothetical protein [Caldilineaceae bacterium]
MNEIYQDDYQVKYDPEAASVICAGSFRLRGPEYEEVLAILNEAADAGHNTLMLDVTGLEFLNSSGINTLSKFVLLMRQQKSSQLVVKGTERHAWQKKSLSNLQRLLPNMQLELVQ